MVNQWIQYYIYDDNDNTHLGDVTKMIILMIIDEDILVGMSFHYHLTNIGGMYFILSLHTYKNSNSNSTVDPKVGKVVPVGHVYNGWEKDTATKVYVVYITKRGKAYETFMVIW